MSVTPPHETPENPLRLDPRTYQRGLGCVHCGLCLPACPTYTETGHEADSPRGRIQLMLGISDGTVRPTESVRAHLDLCLDCRSCETACPSGVVYHELIEETRQRLAATTKLSITDRLLRWTFFHVFTRPTRLKLAVLPARLLQKLGILRLADRIGLMRLIPEKFRKLVTMLPEEGPLWPGSLPERSRGGGLNRVLANLHPATRPASPSRKIAFFEGCIGSVLFSEVNRKSVELMAFAGADVQVPRSQVCCGAIHHHNSDSNSARKFAKANIDAFCPVQGEGPEFVVANIAGCGAMLRDYAHLLRDDPDYAGRAKDFSRRVRDISEVLVALQLTPTNPISARVTVHDPCHLLHAQRVSEEPRKLLAGIQGLELVPLSEPDICCGAAGTYNLTHPAMAGRLAERKLDSVCATGASICVSGNAGCTLHLQGEAKRRGLRVRVVHPVELIHAAVFGADSGPGSRA